MSSSSSASYWGGRGLILTRQIRKRAIEKFGEDKLPRIYRIYALTRLLQIRRLRMPEPQVKREGFPK